MRVGHSGSNSVQPGESAATKGSGKANASGEGKRAERGGSSESGKSARGAANTEISAKSKEFAQAKSVASDAPDVRQDRVSDLKKRIAEGSYKVDADAVADRLVDDHLRMSGR